MYDVRATTPQSVGDLIGRAFRFYRTNVPLILQVLIWPTVISIAGKVLMQWGITTISREVVAKEWSLIAASGVAIFVGLIVFCVALFYLNLRQMALVRLANGFAPDFATAYTYLRSRGGAVFGLMVIGQMILFGAVMFWTVELVVSALMAKGGPALQIGCGVGICVGIIGMIASALLYWLVGLVVLSVIACEDTGIPTTIGRGFSLSMHDFGRTLLLGFVLLVTIQCLAFPLAIPTVILSFFEFFRSGMSAEHLPDAAKIPPYLLVLGQSWESVVNMFLWPIIWLAYGLFYYDLRVRQEGLDVLTNLRLLEQRNAS